MQAMGVGDESIYASCQDIWKHCNSSVRQLFPAPTSLLAPKRGFRESQLAAHKDEDRGWMQVKLVPRVIRAGVNPGLKRSQFPLDTYSNFITALTALTTSCSCSCICARVLCVTRYCIWQIHGAASPRERPSGRVNDAAHALTVETTTANTDKKTNSTTHTHTLTHICFHSLHPSSVSCLLLPHPLRQTQLRLNKFTISSLLSTRVHFNVHAHTLAHQQLYIVYVFISAWNKIKLFCPCLKCSDKATSLQRL